MLLRCSYRISRPEQNHPVRTKDKTENLATAQFLDICKKLGLLMALFAEYVEVSRGTASSADKCRQNTVLRGGDSAVLSSERSTRCQILPHHYTDPLGTG